ncbi:heavy-metal-associated domain-containing protein [Spirochaeta dissipatitropha]
MALFSPRKESVYKVSNMNCGHCAAKIQDRLSALKGIKKVHADVAAGSIAIQSTGKLVIDELNVALEDTDYRILEEQT